MTNTRIEICGVIAAGKTSIAHLFAGGDFAPVFEQFAKHPFLEAFYQDPAQYSFETEITFLLQHYHDIKVAKENNPSIICDFSLVLDRAFADVTLSESRRRLFKSIADELEQEIGLPSILVYLKCPEKILLQRIKNRNRIVEQSIAIEYISDLSKAVKRRIEKSSRDISVVEIDSNQFDFVTCPEDKQTVKDLILKST